jgi:hypothetical protein
MSTLICFSLSSTLRPRSVVASLALHELESGSPVSVLDVSRFSYVRQDLPPSWFARLCGQTVHHSALEEFLSERGVPSARLSAQELPRALPDHVEREFQDAVRSELVTYVRSDSPNEKSLFVKTSAKRMADAARPAYWALRDYLDNNRPQKILIPNGRVAHQRLLLLAAQDLGVPVDAWPGCEMAQRPLSRARAGRAASASGSSLAEPNRGRGQEGGKERRPPARWLSGCGQVFLGRESL